MPVSSTLELVSSAPPDPRKLSVVVRLILVVVLTVLVSPLIVYMAAFGVSISHDHTRWGEMGSAMSGIYLGIPDQRGKQARSQPKLLDQVLELSGEPTKRAAGVRHFHPVFPSF